MRYATFFFKTTTFSFRRMHNVCVFLPPYFHSGGWTTFIRSIAMSVNKFVAWHKRRLSQSSLFTSGMSVFVSITIALIILALLTAAGTAAGVVAVAGGGA
jgi:hypothetical protein